MNSNSNSNTNSKRFDDVEDAVDFLATVGEDVTWWGFAMFAVEWLSKSLDIDQTRCGTEVVVRDPRALEGAMLATLCELLSDNGASFDGDERRAGDWLVWCNTLADAPDLHGEQAQVCCGCGDVVIEPDPYSGLPKGTVFIDGEGWQCSGCSTEDPQAAMREELAVQGDGGTTTSDLTCVAIDAGWIVADLRDDQVKAMREAGQPYLLMPIAQSRLYPRPTWSTVRLFEGLGHHRRSSLPSVRVAWPRKSAPVCAGFR